MTGLEGVRVLELGQGVSAAYASKLLADLGADVVKLEAPGGDLSRARGPFPDDRPDPECSGLFLYLNTNKRSAVLDLERPSDRRQLDAWVAASDLVVSNLSLRERDAFRLHYADLERVHPGAVVCSITPFGTFGPYSAYRAEELQSAHASGWTSMAPGGLGQPELPPLKTFGHQADFIGGVTGATAALGALLRSQTRGVGEHVDVSVQECVASMLEMGLIGYSYAGRVAHRCGARSLNPWKIYRCRDGLIFLCVIEQDQWHRLVELMGRPDWAELDVFASVSDRMRNADLLDGFVQEWIAGWSVDELYREGQAQRVCFAPVYEMHQLSEQPQLAERAFFVPVRHPRAGELRHPGAPYKLTRPWWKLRRPAPLLGEHTAEVTGEWSRPRSPARAELGAASAAPSRPLDGIRVLDFTWVWAGPYAAMQLAFLGAEVVKLESVGRPDLGRRLPVHAPEISPQTLDTSGYFNQWNQAKRSLRIDLGQPRAIELVLELVAHADVVIDNFATGVMDRLGLSDARLREVRPDLIVASMSGYGHTGPCRDYMGYGPAIGALSGLYSLTGHLEGAPEELGLSLGDPVGGLHTSAAICAALVARCRSGEGQHIDVSLWEATTALAAEGWMEFAMNGRQPARRGNRDGTMAPHGCYPCAGDDEWIAIACADDAEWLCLAQEIGGDLAADPRFATASERKRNEATLDALIAGWTGEWDRWDLTRRLQGRGIPAFPTLTVADLAVDPHLRARGFLERLEHPAVGARLHAGVPWRLTHALDGVPAPAPLLGADTEAVLREWLAYPDERIAELGEAKVLY